MLKLKPLQGVMLHMQEVGKKLRYAITKFLQTF